MSLKDKDIDKMYSASAERLSFEYNESYWDEFESQLSKAQGKDGSKKALTDAEIDSMYASGVAGLAFDYKPEYLDEFNASMPDAPKKAALTDEEIDSMYAASAAGLSFDYNKSYWNEFNELDAAGNTVLADNAIDELYKESANDLSFAYKPSYWEEMKERLRRGRRPDFLWFATAYTFVGVIGVSLFMGGTSVQESNQFVANTSGVKSLGTANNTNSNIAKRSNANLEISNIVASTASAEITNSNLNGQGSNSTLSNESLINNANIGNPTNEVTSIDPINGTGENPEALENPNGTTGIAEENGSNSIVPIPNESVIGVVNVEKDPRLVGSTNENNASDPNENLETQATGTNDIAVDDERIILPIKDLERTLVDKSLLPTSPFNFRARPFVLGYVQGAGGLSQSLVNPSDKHSYSFGLGVGMEVRHNKISYTLGVNGLVENHNDLVLNRTAKVYGFGSDVYKFNIDYKQKYTLEGVLGVGYNFGKHKVDLGIRPSFVVSSRVRIEELGTASGVLSDSENDYNESRDVFGFMDGIHRFGLKPTIGYAYRLTPSMSFGVNVGVQVMPSINEDFINGVNNTLPIDGQIYFRKTLSFKR